jgi:hypothetical protein
MKPSAYTDEQILTIVKDRAIELIRSTSIADSTSRTTPPLRC